MNSIEIHNITINEESKVVKIQLEKGKLSISLVDAKNIDFSSLSSVEDMVELEIELNLSISELDFAALANCENLVSKKLSRKLAMINLESYRMNFNNLVGS